MFVLLFEQAYTSYHHLAILPYYSAIRRSLYEFSTILPFSLPCSRVSLSRQATALFLPALRTMSHFFLSRGDLNECFETEVVFLCFQHFCPAYLGTYRYLLMTSTLWCRMQGKFVLNTARSTLQLSYHHNYLRLWPCTNFFFNWLILTRYVPVWLHRGI